MCIRDRWAAAVNTKFEEKGLDGRIDHRSYVRQGRDLIPTVHEGANVRQMEAKGIRTEKGELNRWIKADVYKRQVEISDLAEYKNISSRNSLNPHFRDYNIDVWKEIAIGRAHV